MQAVEAGIPRESRRSRQRQPRNIDKYDLWLGASNGQLSVQHVTHSGSVLDKSLPVHDETITSEIKSTSSAQSCQTYLSSFWPLYLVADIWGCWKSRRHLDFSLGEVWSTPCSLLSPDTCLSQGLTQDSPSFWSKILWFPPSLWYNLVEEPSACGKGLGVILKGLLDGTYGNYSLIYHLGHANSCKLGFY